MELPIHQNYRSKRLNWPNTLPKLDLIAKAKDHFFNHSGFELFDVKPQMPKQQISHFVKQAIQSDSLVAVQINQEEDIVSEIIGYPAMSPHSHHLIIEGYSNKVTHLVSGSDIRHIRKI